jgi:predicted nucleotidyltransferase component of viral defense system
MPYYNTVNPALKETLHIIMNAKEFEAFRLVGGTALSLQIGHRMSVDIDLFSDLPYGKINFKAIDDFIENTFPFFSHNKEMPSALGKSYLVGSNIQNSIKLDIFYTDEFIQPFLLIDNIRMATVEEIIAMKIDIIQRGARKKDFWDLHELLDQYSIDEMLDFHLQRYPYNHEPKLILKNFVDFLSAEDDFNPICLKGKYWVFIKEDIERVISEYLNQ